MSSRSRLLLLRLLVGRAVDVHAAVPDVSSALDRAPVHEDGMF